MEEELPIVDIKVVIEDVIGLQIKERKVRDYDCPEFILSEKEDKRIAKPWKNGVILVGNPPKYMENFNQS